ncbi:hypothetical protein ACU4GD_18105 [Cupriavidus basilensis]
MDNTLMILPPRPSAICRLRGELGEEEGALEIGVDSVVERLLTHFDKDARRKLTAGVVDQYVHPPGKRLHSLASSPSANPPS